MKIRNMSSVFLTMHDMNLDANEFLDNCSDEEFFKFRRKIEEARKKFPIALCSVCYQPVVLRGDAHRTKFFAHTKNSADCPIKTTTNLTEDELRALKYNGQKEGAAHRINKEKIAKLLLLDDLFEDDVKVEATFRQENHVGISKEWRRPDISCVLKHASIQLVIELQVSTTFLDVIINREAFYRRNGAYILWVFISFDPDKFTTLDIAYGNFANVFVFDSEAEVESEKFNKLILKCYYRMPYITEFNTISYAWECELVDFNILSFKEESKKVYYKDTENMKEIAMNELYNRDQEVKRMREQVELARQSMNNLNGNQASEKVDRVKNEQPINSQYKNKQHRFNASSLKSIQNIKNHERVQCNNCGYIGKARKIGTSVLCAKCFQPI